MTELPASRMMQRLRAALATAGLIFLPLGAAAWACTGSSDHAPGYEGSRGAAGRGETSACSPSNPHEGCPCTQAGERAACGEIVTRSDSYITCSMGMATCDGTTWGPCVGNRFVSKNTESAKSLRPYKHPLYSTAACSAPCDPNPSCTTATGAADDVDASGVYPAQGGGLTLSPGDAATFSDAHCTGFQCNVISCGGHPDQTTITGTVTDPAGNNPLYNVTVYVPVDANGKLPAFTEGVTCDTCSGADPLNAVSVTTTASDGTFTLTHVPSGLNIPIVVQSGKWRREILLTSVSSCTNNTVANNCTATDKTMCTLRLPRNQTDGYDPVAGTYTHADMPRMAIVTGAVDPLECMMLKAGISPTEFSSWDAHPANPLPGGAKVHFFHSDSAPGTKLDAHFGNQVVGSRLWLDSAPSTVQAPHYNYYDVVLLPCEGAAFDKEPLHTRSAGSGDPYANLIHYTDVGGRAFITHFGYVWLEYPAQKSYVAGPNNWSGVASWTNVTGTTFTQDPLTANITSTFPKGRDFSQWLFNTGASDTLGQLTLHEGRKDLTTVGTGSQAWMGARHVPSWGSSVDFVPHFTFNTPYLAASGNQCGRVVFSDFHVSASALVHTATTSTCIEDAQCGFGQSCITTCDGGQTCSAHPGTAGSCNEPCATASDCPDATYTCTGATAGQCLPKSCTPDDYVCSIGACHNNTSCYCTANSQCPSGKCVNDGQCTTGPCTGSGAKDSATNCQVDAVTACTGNSVFTCTNSNYSCSVAGGPCNVTKGTIGLPTPACSDASMKCRSDNSMCVCTSDSQCASVGTHQCVNVEGQCTGHGPCTGKTGSGSYYDANFCQIQSPFPAPTPAFDSCPLGMSGVGCSGSVCVACTSSTCGSGHTCGSCSTSGLSTDSRGCCESSTLGSAPCAPGALDPTGTRCICTNDNQCGSGKCTNWTGCAAGACTGTGAAGSDGCVYACLPPNSCTTGQLGLRPDGGAGGTQCWCTSNSQCSSGKCVPWAGGCTSPACTGTDSTTLCPPQIDHVSSGKSNSNIVTVSHTFSAGTNKKLVVIANGEYSNSGLSVSSVQYGGVALTKATETVVSVGSSNIVSIWYLDNGSFPATPGPYDVVVTYNHSVASGLVHVIGLTNAMQGGVEATASQTDTNKSNISANITTITRNALIIDSVEINNADTLTPADSAQTVRSTLSGNSNGGSVATEIAATTGNKTLRWNAGDSEGRLVEGAVAIAPASAGLANHCEVPSATCDGMPSPTVAYTCPSPQITSCTGSQCSSCTTDSQCIGSRQCAAAHGGSCPNGNGVDAIGCCEQGQLGRAKCAPGAPSPSDTSCWCTSDNQCGSGKCAKWSSCGSGACSGAEGTGDPADGCVNACVHTPTSCATGGLDPSGSYCWCTRDDQCPSGQCAQWGGCEAGQCSGGADAGAAPGTPQIDRVSTGTAGSKTVTVSHTFSAGQNKKLVVLANGENMSATPGVTNVQYNGVSLTKAIEKVINNNNLVSIWYLDNGNFPATAGAYNVVVTYNNTVDWGLVHVIGLTNAAQGAPEATGWATATNSTTISLSITTVANNAMIIDGVEINNAGVTSLNPDVAQTRRSFLNGNSNGGASATELATTAGSKTVSWTASSSQQRLVAAAVSIAPPAVVNDHCVPLPLLTATCSPSVCTGGTVLDAESGKCWCTSDSQCSTGVCVAWSDGTNGCTSATCTGTGTPDANHCDAAPTCHADTTYTCNNGIAGSTCNTAHNCQCTSNSQCASGKCLPWTGCASAGGECTGTGTANLFGCQVPTPLPATCTPSKYDCALPARCGDDHTYCWCTSDAQCPSGQCVDWSGCKVGDAGTNCTGTGTPDNAHCVPSNITDCKADSDCGFSGSNVEFCSGSESGTPGLGTCTCSASTKCGTGQTCTGGKCTGCTSGSQCKGRTYPATCEGGSGALSGRCCDTWDSSACGLNAGLFPEACLQSPMSDQEKALEFMFFDLTACVTPDQGTPTPPPQQLTAQTFPLDFTSACPQGASVKWRELQYQVSMPSPLNGASISFAAQTAGPAASTFAPSPALPLTTATTNTALPNYDVVLLDTSPLVPGTTPDLIGMFTKATPPVASESKLRIWVTLTPTADQFYSPTLIAWNVIYDCPWSQ